MYRVELSIKFLFLLSLNCYVIKICGLWRKDYYVIRQVYFYSQIIVIWYCLVGNSFLRVNNVFKPLNIFSVLRIIEPTSTNLKIAIVCNMVRYWADVCYLGGLMSYLGGLIHPNTSIHKRMYSLTPWEYGRSDSKLSRIEISENSQMRISTRLRFWKKSFKF